MVMPSLNIMGSQPRLYCGVFTTRRKINNTVAQDEALSFAITTEWPPLSGLMSHQDAHLEQHKEDRLVTDYRSGLLPPY